MNRKALIISVPDTLNQTDLPGTKIDSVNWYTYLTSLVGGAWDDEEIIRLENPSSADVLSTVKRLSDLNIDFGFVAFSGHGYVKNIPQIGILKNQIILHDGKELSSNDLSISRKGIVLLDSCREVVNQPLNESIEKGFADIRNLGYRNQASRFQIRNLFWELNYPINSGTIFCYGCELNEFAREDKRDGGLFTKELILKGKRSTNFSFGNYIDFSRQFLETRKSVIQISDNEQHPVLEGGRRIKWPVMSFGTLIS